MLDSNVKMCTHIPTYIYSQYTLCDGYRYILRVMVFHRLKMSQGEPLDWLDGRNAFWDNFFSVIPLQWFFKMSTSIYRPQVLSLYRQILRLARSWTSVTGQSDQTQEEKKYIYSEAKRLFRNNKEVSFSTMTFSLFSSFTYGVSKIDF